MRVMDLPINSGEVVWGMAFFTETVDGSGDVWTYVWMIGLLVVTLGAKVSNLTVDFVFQTPGPGGLEVKEVKVPY